jgi:HPt (histidine-containing phosphotransfer) domain-containing protein
MADDKRDDRFGGADALRALAEVRNALESVEREQDRVLEDRRGLRARLEGLLEALREEALVLRFDANRELVEASGPVEEQLGASAAELVSNFEEFADEETLDALDDANRAVLDEASAGASVSDGFLRSADEDLAVTWIHVRRWDEDGELSETEVIGLVAPLVDTDEGLGAAGDPFDSLLEHMSQGLLDDVGDASVTRAVETFGDFLSADRVVINRYDDEARRFSVMSSWLRGDTPPLDAEVRGISISELPWAYSALSAGEAVVVSGAADLPADAVAERELYAGGDAKASLLIPMVRNERLTGFISIQAARQERDWGEPDVSRSRKFAVALSAALARAEAGEALAAARGDLEEASEGSAAAEARAQEAEARASEAQQKLDELDDETDAVRARVAEVEAELEAAKKSESEAREAGDDASNELESARQEAEEAAAERDALKQEAEGARADLENLKEDAERAQRRSEDTAADALGVRTEIEDMRVQVEEARREAAEARAELRQLRDAGGTSTDEVDAGVPEPADVEADTPEPEAPEPEAAAIDLPEPAAPGDYDPAPTVEMRRTRPEEEAFDPDATVEIEPPSVESEEASEDGEASEDEVAAETTVGQEVEEEAEAETEASGTSDPEATVEVQLPSRLKEPDGEELPRAVSLDEMLERTQTSGAREPGPDTWKADKASWEDSVDEVVLPEFLETDDEEADAGDSAEADAEVAGDEVDEGGLVVGDAEEAVDSGDIGDVEAARRLARQVAGKDEGDVEEAVEEGAAPDATEDAAEHEGDDVGEIVVEPAWDEIGADADETTERDTEPGAVILPDAIEPSIDEVDTLDGPGTDEPTDGEPPPAIDEPAVPDAPAGEPAAQLPDLAGVDAGVGLEDVGGNVELYRSLLTKFRTDYIGAAAKIDSAIEKGNIEVAHLLLHAVKGVAGNLGATGVRDAADELETQLISHDPDGTKKAAEDFTAVLDGVLDSIAALDNEADAPAPPTEEPSAPGPEVHVSDPMVLRSYLSGLRQHLLAEKLRQCQLVMREITARNWPGDYNERVVRLAGLIEERRFEEARAAFEDLMGQFAGN